MNPRYIPYTAVWNALDYPAAILPVSTVNPELDTKRPPHQFLSPDDEKNYNFCEPHSTML
jgi:amidase